MTAMSACLCCWICFKAVCNTWHSEAALVHPTPLCYNLVVGTQPTRYITKLHMLQTKYSLSHVINSPCSHGVYRCWKSLMRISRVSLFQQDVSDVVAALQIEHQMEYLAQDGLFSVDVAILGEDKNIAIEVDGPYHYTLNTHQPLGHTLVR